MNNILIQECKVFVNIEGEMRETTDYSLIGAAVLQASEDKQLKVSM